MNNTEPSLFADLDSDLDMIQSLLEWHADPGADIDDPSPEDAHAHCNGLALQALSRIRSRLARLRAGKPL